jgi:hypothetical protein
MNINTFEVVIGDEVAFELRIDSKHNDFLQVVESNPEVVLSNLEDICVGDSYLDGKFFDLESNERTSLIENEEFSRFVFVKDGDVLFIQDILNTAEKIIAAYSSNPTFRKI